jgi:hypothetical protein
MKIPKTILLLAVTATLLAGCSTKNTSTPLSITPSVAFTPSQTRTVTVTRRPPTSSLTLTLTPTSTPLPSATPTPTAPPQPFQDHCLEVLPTLPQNARSDGVLILFDDYKQPLAVLRDMKTGQEIPLPEQENIDHLKVSPDGRWMAYWLHQSLPGNAGLSASQVVIAGADGRPYKLIPWEEGWEYIAGWLDNERVLINKMGKDRYDIDSLIVLNPFTGQRTEFAPIYPQMEGTDPTWWNLGRMVFDPTLTRVVYPSYDIGKPRSIVLWDVTNNQHLASVSVILASNPEPKWSPDGRQVLVEALTSDEPSSAGTYNVELYSIAFDGQVTQLTHFSDVHPQVYPDEFSWSPDGQKIAFWIQAVSEPYKHQQLAVLDMTTGNVTNYCIPGFLYGRAGRPVWSPNGQQLAVQNLYDEQNNSHTILVDIVNGWAARIAEGLTPVGWMVSP